MVGEPPISFSPFSFTDCTMLSHFSFNDFVAIAFPDLARDLDIQIEISDVTSFLGWFTPNDTSHYSIIVSNPSITS